MTTHDSSRDPYAASTIGGVTVRQALLADVGLVAPLSAAVRIELATQLTNGNALALYESEGFARDNEFVHLSRTT